MADSYTYVDNSDIHGKGLFAKYIIPAGTAIGTIEGEYTTVDGEHVLWLDERTGILVKSDLRYINHSDTPNAAYYDDLTVWALQDIQAGEEITHNYNQAGATDEDASGGMQADPVEIRYRQHWLPWILLALSWLGMAVYIVFAG